MEFAGKGTHATFWGHITDVFSEEYSPKHGANSLLFSYLGIMFQIICLFIKASNIYFISYLQRGRKQIIVSVENCKTHSSCQDNHTFNNLLCQSLPTDGKKSFFMDKEKKYGKSERKKWRRGIRPFCTFSVASEAVLFVTAVILKWLLEVPPHLFVSARSRLVSTLMGDFEERPGLQDRLVSWRKRKKKRQRKRVKVMGKHFHITAKKSTWMFTKSLSHYFLYLKKCITHFSFSWKIQKLYMIIKISTKGIYPASVIIIKCHPHHQ